MPCPQLAPSPSMPLYRTTTVRQPPTVTLLTLLAFLAMLVGTLLAQPTDAFLLSHRNLLAPFASTRMAHANTGAVAAVEPAQAVQPVQAPPAEEDAEEAEGSEADQPHRHLHLAGYLLVPAGADLQYLQSAVADLLPDDLQSAGAPEEALQTADTDMQEQPLMLRQVAKRMHHLSILRKIGAPGTSSAASRLFGPQRQRELKRRAPLWVINY